MRLPCMMKRKNLILGAMKVIICLLLQILEISMKV